MKRIIFAIAALTLTAAVAAEERYIGVGSILCDTEAAAEQVLVVDKEYDGTVGNCIVTPFPLSGKEIRAPSFFNPIGAWRIDGVGIVYAATAWLK